MARRRRSQPTEQTLHDGAAFDGRAAREQQLRLAADELERCRRFHEWGDPFLGAWHAYETARSNAVEVPEWVHNYLARVASRMGQISSQAARRLRNKREQTSAEELGRMVLRAIEYPLRKGDGLFLRRENAMRDVVLATMVAERVRRGEPVTRAQNAVATERAVDVQMVQRAWRAIGRPVKERHRSLTHQ